MSLSPASVGATRGAREQTQPQTRFENTDGLAERRLRNPETLRRPCEVPLLSHREEGGQIVQAVAGHSEEFLLNTRRI